MGRECAKLQISVQIENSNSANCKSVLLSDSKPDKNTFDAFSPDFWMILQDFSVILKIQAKTIPFDAIDKLEKRKNKTPDCKYLGAKAGKE